MPHEIERKFLVQSADYKKAAFSKTTMKQGYLSSVPERTVRIRIQGDKGFITIKGIGDSAGITRYEWEKEISIGDAEELLHLCEPGVIEKNRFNVRVGDHVIEVDEFDGENKGLVIAEIELDREDEAFEKPNWLGREITGDNRYYNAMLAKKPFRTWTTS